MGQGESRDLAWLSLLVGGWLRLAKTIAGQVELIQ